MNIILKNAHWYAGGSEGSGDIRISGGRIESIGKDLSPRSDEHLIECAGYLALPGLINAHDHLGLNLFPRRGNPPYANFYQWARDVYRPDEPVQQEITRLALRDRLLWGGFKNLIAGVTTVVHHDPFSREVFEGPFPVDVLRRYGWAHSHGFGTHIRWKSVWSRIRRRPFIIHAAEGTDDVAAREIDRLHAAGILASNTVLVHAIALESHHMDILAKTGSSVVWCPASNHFLYGATCPISSLRCRGIPVALGTDSTLSGSPTLLHEIRHAHRRGLATAEELLGMVTVDAARILRLSDGRGSLRSGGRADITIFPDRSSMPAEALLHHDPSLVLVQGRVRLAQEDMADRLGIGPCRHVVGGRPTWLCGDLGNLRRRIAAGVRAETLDQNELWRMPAFAETTDFHHSRATTTR